MQIIHFAMRDGTKCRGTGRQAGATAAAGETNSNHSNVTRLIGQLENYFGMRPFRIAVAGAVCEYYSATRSSFPTTKM